MGVWAKRVRKFMLVNGYFKTDIQKGFHPKISGRIEHNQSIVDILKENLASGKDVFVIWMDLQNAFGSVKH